MKNIIKTAFCLIVISSILLYSSISHAANPVNITVPSSANVLLYLDDSYNPPIDSTDQSLGDYCIYKYYTTFLVYIDINGTDGYINGNINFSNILTVNTPSDFTLQGISYDYTPINGEGYYVNFKYSTVQDPIPTTGAIQTRIIFYNYWVTTNMINVAEIKIYSYLSISKNNSNAYNPPRRLSGSISYSQIINRTDFTAIPVTGQGFGLVLKQAITDALHDGELDLVYDYLVLWKTTQDGYLADIELSVDDVETWLSYINSAQATLQNKIDLIYTLEQTFPGYFNSMISLLQQIRDMNASDTAAESQMQNAEQQLSQAVNDMEVQKPNINNVVNAGDQYMDSNITGAQGDTFFWLHGTNIFVTILTMAVTIGILGFVIYGKSG